MLIDPIRLAQFMALPGAAELVEAFASLPPGEVRDSAVAHVQVLARACGWTPPAPFDGRMGRETAQLVRDTPRRLPSPFAENLVATSVEGQIVERAIKGEAPEAIADGLGLRLGLVTQAMGKARREGGVVFPGDGDKPKGKAKAKPAKSMAGKRGYTKAGKRLPELMPVPPGPWWWEDDASPVWDNPKLLPALSERADGSMAGVGPLDCRAYSTMTNAAARRGQTLRQYIASRFEILRRAEAGETPTQIALAMRVTPYEVYGLLQKVGRGRMQMAQEAQRVAETAEYIPSALAAAPKAPAAHADDPRAHAARVMAATKWGFEDVERYEHARGRVRVLRLQGLAPALIATRIGQPYSFVKSALDHFRAAGVVWPPIDINAQVREETAAA